MFSCVVPCASLVAQFLRLNRRMNVMWQSIHRAAWDLIAFSILILLVFFGYTVMGMLTFGQHMRCGSIATPAHAYALLCIRNSYPPVDACIAALCHVYGTGQTIVPTVCRARDLDLSGTSTTCSLPSGCASKCCWVRYHSLPCPCLCQYGKVCV